MKNSLLPAALISFFMLAACSHAEPPMRQIEVSGTGKITEQPDIATTSFTFSQRSKVAAQGKKLVDTQVNNLLSLCKKLGIKEADVQAAKFTVYPEYDYKRNRELIGYRVNREVQIKVRDLQVYPRLLEGSVGIGATHSGSLTLDFSNREALENQAMINAFERAKEKATLLAKQANGSLGDALWISETGSSYRPPMPMRMAAAKMESDAAAYPTGDMELSKQVLVRFELKN